MGNKKCRIYTACDVSQTPIGLYKLGKRCKEFGGDIYVMQDILDDKNAVKFKMILPI